MNNLRTFTSKEKEEIIQYYNKGNSQRACKNKFKVSIEILKKVFQEYNISIRNHSTSMIQYFQNNTYFKNIDSPDKAYFLGLLTADGWVFSTGNGGFEISLQERDGYILELFKKYIEYTGTIKNYLATHTKNPMKNFRINCKELYQDLAKYGVVPRKSHKTYFPDIPEHLWSHFIRGVFDGDGCISLKNNINGSLSHSKFNIIGNFTLIKEIQNILISKCQINKTKLSVPNKTTPNIVSVVYGGNLNLIKIRDYLYKDCEDLYLIRKKEKFDSIVSMTIGPKCKKVLQLDKNNILIKEWGSLKEAANGMNHSHSSNIMTCCKKRTRFAYGYKWEYKK